MKRKCMVMKVKFMRHYYQVIDMIPLPLSRCHSEGNLLYIKPQPNRYIMWHSTQFLFISVLCASAA